MAIELPISLPTGLSAEAAYARVSRLSAHYPRGHAAEVRIDVDAYLDATARQTGKTPIAPFSYVVPAEVENPDTGVFEPNPAFETHFSLAALEAEGMNPVKAAYLYLKTLPDFAGGIDV